jgi:type I restriction enzyme M protein
MMGTIFEELIRKFNEALNENPGEHFTPRDVVHLMVRLLVEGEDEKLGRERPIVTVHDPCCGTGGMLRITKDVIQGSPKLEGLNPNADVHLFGQEVNPETFAICKADLFIKGDGSDADNILFGSTLAADRHAGRGLDYMIANPPYGKDWKRDEQAVKAAADLAITGSSPSCAPVQPTNALRMFHASQVVIRIATAVRSVRDGPTPIDDWYAAAGVTPSSTISQRVRGDGSRRGH